MGVYSKGMEMPTSCDKCPFCDGEAWCLIPGDWRLRYNIAHGERLSTCPLVHVPEHGDLVDRDEMFVEFVVEGQKTTRYKVGEKWELNGEEIRCVIQRLPTVIPAERGE